MRKVVRISLWVAGALAALLLLVAAALIFFIDAEPYRGPIQARLERTLDRQVRFGGMKLSILPALGLRLDDFEVLGKPGEPEEILLSAKSLRVGARLLPLLKQRLEVTSIVVDRPVFTLHRAADGSWRPSSLLAEEQAGEPQADQPGAFSVRDVRIRDGKLALRLEGGASLTLKELSLRLRDLMADGPFRFEFSAAIGEMPDSAIRADGAGMMDGSKFSGRLDLKRIDPAALSSLITSFTAFENFPTTLLGDRPFAASTAFELGREKNLLELNDTAVSDIVLNLKRGRDGGWEFAAFLKELGASEDDKQDALELSLGTVKLENALIRIDDAGAPLSFALSGTEMSLGPMESGAPVPVELSCSLDTGAGTGRMAVRGTLGPAVEIDFDLEPVAVGGLAALLPKFAGLDAAAARIGAKVKIRGDFSKEADFVGSASLSGLTASLDSPSGAGRAVPVDLKLAGGIGMTGGGERLELRDLSIEPSGGRSGPLSFRGTIDLSGETTIVDIRLLPARIVADDLAALAALLAPDLPVSFSSQVPVELEVAVRGPLGGEAWPDMSGRARLSGFTFRHSSMLQPMEQVEASVAMQGKRITVEGLHAVIGASDVAGSITFARPDPPTLVVDLTSKNADFWELFSFIAPEEREEGAATTAAEDDPLSRLVVEGSLSIDRGSLATLQFTDLSGRLDYRNSVLKLDPLELGLYEGRFSGGLVQDMRQSPATLGLQARVDGVSADPFLAANLDLGGVMTGRASSDLAVELRTGDWEAIVGSLSGGGPLRVIDGHLAKIEVLRPLSRVAGVFGERTMKRITRQLSGEGTAFSALEMRLGFAGGRARFDDLKLTAPEFELRGSGAIDMSSAHLDGRFSAVMSQEISALMREEDSRAANLFWDGSQKRVSIPFTLKGPAAEPTAGVDWQSAAKDRVERKATDELRKYLEKKLGQDVQTEAAPVEKAPSTGLRAEITRLKRGGTLLLPDLVIEGVVEGTNLARASVVVTDARGRELKKVDSIPAVTDHLQAAADPAAPARIGWKVSVDGKKLALASYPIAIELTLFDTEGNSTSTASELRD